MDDLRPSRPSSADQAQSEAFRCVSNHLDLTVEALIFLKLNVPQYIPKALGSERVRSSTKRTSLEQGLRNNRDDDRVRLADCVSLPHRPTRWALVGRYACAVKGKRGEAWEPP